MADFEQQQHSFAAPPNPFDFGAPGIDPFGAGGGAEKFGGPGGIKFESGAEMSLRRNPQQQQQKHQQLEEPDGAGVIYEQNHPAYATAATPGEYKAKGVQSELTPPPVIICPSEVEHINITLEKNQQCACKDCGKLFNSVWYLKQHAVKHSNDRPFKCKFCFKTYKFRSNLYQHKCPDRQKSGLGGRRGLGRGLAAAAAAAAGASPAVKQRLETNQALKTKIEANMQQQQQQLQQLQGTTTADATATPPAIQAPPTQQSQQQINADIPDTTTIQNNNGFHSMAASADLSLSSLLASDEEEISYGLCIRALPPPLSGSSLLPPPFMHSPPEETQPPRPPDCIRNTPMPYEDVERFVSANKEKLHPCRKCRVHFPSTETLERHLSAHSQEELFMYRLGLGRHRCESCPQAFESSASLARHEQLHVPVGPWACTGCAAFFRSNMALRRHIDQCRPCRYRPFDVPPGIMETASAPLDASAFIISDADIRPSGSEKESGFGSSPESLMNTTSPASRSATTLIEDFDDENSALLFGGGGSIKKAKKSAASEKDDDEESGFRSRLNSVTQSCSPGSSSAFSSDGGSPIRKLSAHQSHNAVGGDVTSSSTSSFGLSSFGSGASYGTKLFQYEQSVGGGNGGGGGGGGGGAMSFADIHDVHGSVDDQGKIFASLMFPDGATRHSSSSISIAVAPIVLHSRRLLSPKVAADDLLLSTMTTHSSFFVAATSSSSYSPFTPSQDDHLVATSEDSASAVVAVVAAAFLVEVARELLRHLLAGALFITTATAIHVRSHSLTMATTHAGTAAMSEGDDDEAAEDGGRSLLSFTTFIFSQLTISIYHEIAVKTTDDSTPL